MQLWRQLFDDVANGLQKRVFELSQGSGDNDQLGIEQQVNLANGSAKVRGRLIENLCDQRIAAASSTQHFVDRNRSNAIGLQGSFRSTSNLIGQSLEDGPHRSLLLERAGRRVISFVTNRRARPTANFAGHVAQATVQLS